VRYRNVALDHPIPQLLVNARALLTDVSDALWVRLVDLDRSLTARRYAAGCDLVLAVTDRFCPWNEGRRRLRRVLTVPPRLPAQRRRRTWRATPPTWLRPTSAVSG
jgi:Sterol carrier protein domain